MHWLLRSGLNKVFYNRFMFGRMDKRLVSIIFITTTGLLVIIIHQGRSALAHQIEATYGSILGISGMSRSGMGKGCLGKGSEATIAASTHSLYSRKSLFRQIRFQLPPSSSSTSASSSQSSSSPPSPSSWLLSPSRGNSALLAQAVYITGSEKGLGSGV